MNKVRKGRRNSDSPIDGIKDLVRSATPLRLIRKKFSHAPDIVQLETKTDEHSVRNGDRLNHESGAMDVVKPMMLSPDKAHDMQQQQPEQAAASQIDQHPIPANPISPNQNEIFMSPSQSSDMLSPQHELEQNESTKTSEARPVKFDPESLARVQADERRKPMRRNRSNCALETTNDRVDDDMLSAWWFLGSRSVDSAEDNKKEVEPRIAPSDLKSEAQPVDDTRNNNIKESTSSSNKRSISTRIIRSMSSEKTHSFRVKGAQSSSPINELEMSQRSSTSESNSQPKPGIIKTMSSFLSNKQSQPKGGDYTRKEMQKRREWLVGLGGTVNYDQPHGEDCESVTSYHSYPLQKENLQINASLSIREDPNKSPDWYPSILPKQKRKFEDWTPQDSSYGAAVPVCGWIPKRIRKLIEIIFFLLLTALIIFLVVKIGIILTSEHKSSSGTDVDLWTDDDRYIANNMNNNANVDDVVAHDDNNQLRS